MSSAKQINLNPSVLMIVLNSVLHDSRVLREANSLMSSGYKVHIIGMQDKKNDSMKSNVHVELIHVWTRDILPKNIIGWLIKYFEFCVKAIIKIIQLKPDIVHAHDLNTLFPAYIGCLLTKSKIIYDSHELFTERGKFSYNLINKMWSLVEKKLLHKVSAIIAANKSRARIMKSDYGAPYLPTVIMNIPSVQFISRSCIFQDYIKNRGLKNIDQKEIVLYQGGISHNRSLDLLIRSVKSWNQKALLILMGYGDRSYINRLKNLIFELGIQQRVFFHPAVPSHKLLQYTASADIGIVIYKNNCRNNYYCAPNKLFEYAAARIKIAGCDFPEVKGMLEKFGIGYTFSPDSEKSIANCINRLLKIKIEEKQFLNLFDEYNWDKEEGKLLNLYKEISLSKNQQKFIEKP
jgi:glycosyltransferase involved in cell wall biosynthesis